MRWHLQRVTSDEERGKTGPSKDESPQTDLLFAGCDLELLCLSPQTEGPGLPRLLCTGSSLCRGCSLLWGSSASPRKVTPNPISARHGQTHRFRAFPRFQSGAVWVKSFPGLVGLGTEGGGTARASAPVGLQGPGLGSPAGRGALSRLPGRR